VVGDIGARMTAGRPRYNGKNPLDAISCRQLGDRRLPPPRDRGI